MRGAGGRSTRALGAMKSVAISLVGGLVAASIPIAGLDAELRSIKPTIVALCDLRATGSRYVGRSVAIAGRVNQELEYIMLWDKRCPEAIVLLEPEPGAPNVLDCIDGQLGPRCGPLNRNGQEITVIGTLVEAPRRMKQKGRSPLWTATRLAVVGFEAYPKRSVPHGT